MANGKRKKQKEVRMRI